MRIHFQIHIYGIHMPYHVKKMILNVVIFFFEHGEQDRWAIPPVEQVNSGLDSNDVLKRISKILNTMERAQTDNKLIAKHTHLYNDLGLDSLDQVEFGLALESEFEIEINDEEAEQIITVGDAITYIVDHPQAV
eukprot:769_1